MAANPASRRYRPQGVGSFSDWIDEREFEQRTVERVLSQAAVAAQIQRNSSGPAAPATRRRATASAAAPSEAGPKAARARAQAPSPRRTGARASAHVADIGLAPATKHRLEHLRPLATGDELKALRRSARLHRAMVFGSLVIVAAAAIISVVARAEIAKMQLKADAIAPQLASLATQNQLLRVTAQQLSAPARIAAVAQSQLHMVFPSGVGVQAVASRTGTLSATSQPYSLYYSAAGVDPTTTVAPTTTAAPPSSTPSTAVGSAPAGAGGATNAASGTSPGPTTATTAPAPAPASPASSTTNSTTPSSLTLVSPVGASTNSSGG